VICDISIASDTAVFGQVGPKVGSFDAGFGTIYLARVIGEKRAREMWFLCRRYSAQEAFQMGLVNKVVAAADLQSEARAWAAEVINKSPTAIRFLKHSFNSDTASAAGTSAMAFAALELYQDTDEATEGNRAFSEKRAVDYSPFRR
jgi:1,4-dihydroxy-2-naphthoyl-CoA synthase